MAKNGIFVIKQKVSQTENGKDDHQGKPDVGIEKGNTVSFIFYGQINDPCKQSHAEQRMKKDTQNKEIEQYL